MKDLFTVGTANASGLASKIIINIILLTFLNVFIIK